MFYRHANIQRTYKQVSHKQGNKRVLSSDYWVYINWGTYIRGAYIRVGLYSGGGAYIWNEVSVNTGGGLIHGGGLYSGGGLIIFGGGPYSRRFTVMKDVYSLTNIDKILLLSVQL